MKRALNSAVGLVVLCGAMLTLATPASANVIAGNGYSSSYAGESVFTSVGAGQSGQFSAIFFNDGTQTWAPGVVGLLICDVDKVTCNVPSNGAFAQGWFSSTVYATVTTTVAPGQNGFFIYNFIVPVGTPQGTVTTFYGDTGLIATGAELRPEGYFQVNTVPVPISNLTVSPSPASVQVGSTVQFQLSGQAIGSTVTWTVTGGCGAITSAGLFAATAMNSSSQPCTVVATATGGTGIAPVTVYGSPSQVGCSASPTSIIANGGTIGGTAIATISLKDANGNIVANASSPTIYINDVTPGLATMNPTGAVTPISGVVSVTITTTTSPGAIQVSASAANLTGCNVIITSSGPGAAAKTIASFLTTPIASDAISTSTLQIDVTDANGNRVIGDNSTNISITRDAGSSFICNATSVLTGSGGSVGAGSGIATDVQGRVAFIITSTTTPGPCLFTVTTNNPAIIGTSAAMTTQIVGAANKLAVLKNDSPHPTATTGTCVAAATNNTDQSCTTIVVAVEDANSAILTSDSSHTITAAFDSTTCTGAGGGAVTARNFPATSAGKATFVFSSAGAYSGCVITFTSTNVASASATVVFGAAGANHLACTFNPNPIVPDGASQSAGTVKVVDASGNVATAGSYTVTFSRTSPTNVTVQVTTGLQNTSGGYATFWVKSQTTAGTETYAPALQTPSLLPGANTGCDIAVHF